MKVIKDPIKPQADEIIAQAIIDLSQAMKRILAGPLKSKCLVVLLAHDTKLGLGIVETVLNSASRLEETFCKKK